MATSVYLDYAAATPLDASVRAAMTPYLNDKFYNPSALYLAAKQVQQDIKQARQTIATILGIKSSEVIFTAGGTEANNLAIRGVMEAHPGSNVIVSAIEHESVLMPAQQYDYKIAPVQPDGRVDVNQLGQLIDDNTVLISVMYANNEIGTIQPLKDTATIVATIRNARVKAGNSRPLYVHTDAAQATAYLEMHAHSLGVDLMTVNGGKIYGPKQSGLLYVKTGTVLSPQIVGGGQERNMRSGTENVAGIIGLSQALTLVQNRKKEEVTRLKELQRYFIDQLKKNIPKAQINGSLTHRLPNNVHVTIPGADNERLLMELDERGIMCAVGSACSASNDEPSHVLSAIGLSDEEARSSLRFSMGITTTKTDITDTVSELTHIVKAL